MFRSCAESCPAEHGGVIGAVADRHGGFCGNAEGVRQGRDALALGRHRRVGGCDGAKVQQLGIATKAIAQLPVNPGPAISAADDVDPVRGQAGLLRAAVHLGSDVRHGSKVLGGGVQRCHQVAFGVEPGQPQPCIVGIAGDRQSERGVDRRGRREPAVQRVNRCALLTDEWVLDAQVPGDARGARIHATSGQHDHGAGADVCLDHRRDGGVRQRVWRDPRGQQGAVDVQGNELGLHSPGASSVCSATTVDSTPRFTDGSGEILNRGEWWEGIGGPPASAHSRSFFGVPPMAQ